MGLGAYLAAVTERDHYLCEEQRERDEVRERPEDEMEEIYEILEGYGCDRSVLPKSNPLLMVCYLDWEEAIMGFGVWDWRLVADANVVWGRQSTRPLVEKLATDVEQWVRVLYPPPPLSLPPPSHLLY